MKAWPICLLFFLATLSHALIPCPSRCRSCSNGVADCARKSLVAAPRAYPNNTKELNLEGNHIRVLGARSFMRMVNLEKLKMSGNKITSLRNDAFRNTPNLVTLDLTNNRIRRVYRRALRHMNSLRTLTLNQNQIRSLRAIFTYNPNLYQLNLAKNHIRTIGEQDLKPLTGLHYIDLRDNNINFMHPKAFKSLTHLRYLFLNNNPLVRWTGMEWGAPNLQLIDMSHCRLEVVPQPLPASLGDLRLGHNHLTAIQHTDFLNITDLQMLALNDNQLQFVADGTFSHLTQLQEVWLRGNMLQYIPRDLPANLRRLHMDINRISEIETGQFPADSRLEYLTLESNQLRGVAPGAFQGLRFLNWVNFQSNDIRVLEEGAFNNLGTLATLMLSGNPLSRIEEGAFKNLGNLTTLQISHLTTENCTLEGNFLPHMLRLRSLNLMASPGLAQALMAIVDDPQNRHVLRDMKQLDVAYDDLQWVSPKVKVMFPSLTHFILDGNALRCSQNMSWLGQWIRTDRTVNFFNYAPITCEYPARLNGRELKDVGDTEWALPDEADGFRQHSGPQGYGQLQGDSPGEVHTTDRPYPGMDNFNTEYETAVSKEKKMEISPRTSPSKDKGKLTKKPRSDKDKKKRRKNRKDRKERKGKKHRKGKKSGDKKKNGKGDRRRNKENKKRRNKKDKGKKKKPEV